MRQRLRKIFVSWGSMLRRVDWWGLALCSTFFTFFTSWPLRHWPTLLSGTWMEAWQHSLWLQLYWQLNRLVMFTETTMLYDKGILFENLELLEMLRYNTHWILSNDKSSLKRQFRFFYQKLFKPVINLWFTYTHVFILWYINILFLLLFVCTLYI